MTIPRRPGPGVAHTESRDPIPVFRIKDLQVPKEIFLEPGPAGAFENTINRHRISPAAAQELAAQHFAHIKKIHDNDQRERAAYWHAEHVRFKATPGAAEKISAAESLLDRYRKARGAPAHDSARAALVRDGAWHPGVIDVLAYASDPDRHGGGMSKGARRYSGPRFSMARIIIEMVNDWLRPGRSPAYALQQEHIDG